MQNYVNLLLYIFYRNSLMTIFPLLIAANLFFFPVELKINDVKQIDNNSETQSILLIRHGESAFNVPDANGIHFTSGKSLTIPLTERGKKQADDIGNKLIGKLSPNENYVILSSTAIRAQETADRIFEQLKPHFSITRGDSYEGLCERGHGIWEGLPRDEKYAMEVKVWDELSAKDKFLTPMLSTGESYSEVASRGLSDLQKIIDQHPNKMLIIVTHYAAMNAFALKWSDEKLSEHPASPLPSLRFNNCDILRVEVPQGSFIDKAQLYMHIKSEV